MLKTLIVLFFILTVFASCEHDGNDRVRASNIALIIKIRSSDNAGFLLDYEVKNLSLSSSVSHRKEDGSEIKDVYVFTDEHGSREFVSVLIEGDSATIFSSFYKVSVFFDGQKMSLSSVRNKVSPSSSSGNNPPSVYELTLGNKESEINSGSKAVPDTGSSTAPAAFGSLPLVTMTAAEYRIDPIGLNHERENPPFEFRGGAGTGRVIDRQGNVLLESSEAIAIFGAAVGPDKEKVLVKGGNAINFVLEPSSGRKIELPELPPGVNMLGFGDWHWIGSDRLFGTSGVEKIFHEGSHENCCNENNVAQTKFYTFDLVMEQLSEVVMPGAVTQPVVNVVDVMSDGHIHLLHEAPHEDVEQDLGWFKIDAGR